MSAEVFIALFRGINVGGRNTVKMGELREMFEGLGLRQARTYVQSGNVVFGTDEDEPEALEGEIEARFAAEFGFRPRIMVRSRADWSAMIKANPYATEAAEDLAKVHAFVLGAAPDASEIAALSEIQEALAGPAAADRFKVKGAVLYLHTPNGFGRSKLAEIIGRMLSVDMTARNWRTVEALADIAAAE